MVKYLTTNDFSIGKLEFHQFTSSYIKSQREDFNDMFVAENNFRISRGDLSIVFVLTYNDEHIHKVFGQNMLDSDDLKRFSKSSRFSKYLARTLGYSFDFVCVGEFGEGGRTHHYYGRRGAGNNPHYHCIGWFHRIGERNHDSLLRWLEKVGLPLQLAMYQDKDLLPLLVRFEWQGCLDDDIYQYAANFWSRSKGLGFVCLDGPVRSSYSGGSYIGKYIGKDIRSLYLNTYKDYFVPNLVTTLYSCCKEWLYNENQSYDFHFAEFDLPRFDVDIYSLIYHWAFETGKKSVLRFYPFTPSDLPAPLLQEKRLWHDHEFLILSPWLVLKDYLTEHYKMFKSEFDMYMSTRYSPKVRKFHGFGYSLLRDVDIEKGTYTIYRKCGEVHRCLPPSLARYLYYDHYSVSRLAEPVVYSSAPVVKYVLNDKGRKHLAYSLKHSILQDLVYIQNKGSEQLKSLALQTSVLAHCLILYNPVYDKKKTLHDYCDYFTSYLMDLDFAVSYAIQCRQTIVHAYNFKENRVFLDVDRFFCQHFPTLYECLEELRSIHYQMMESKDKVDAEYISHLYNTYLHEY